MELNNQIKVVHIMTGFGGGITSFIKNKAEYFANDNQIIFDVITFDNVSIEFKKLIESTGGEVFKITNPQKSIVKFIKELSIIYRKQPQNTVVHSHLGMNLGGMFYLVAKRNGIDRFVIHAHTSAPKKIVKSFNNRFNRFFNTLYNRFNRFFNALLSQEKLSCGIDASANIFGARYVRNNKIFHIPNSINENYYLKNKDKNDLKRKILGTSSEKKIIIGNIARFHPLKNHMFMIEIIEKLQEKERNFLWLFIGDGAQRENIEKEIKKRKLSDNVKFMGRRNDIPDLLKIMDFFVLPSFYEGLPTVAIEAQASGTTTLLSEEISSETDLGMGLVSFLPIHNPINWVDQILEKKVKKPIDSVQRKKILEEKRFTNKSSAELYRQFLEKKRVSYKI